MDAFKSTSPPLSPPEKLKFDVPASVAQTVKDACSAYDKTCDTVEHMVCASALQMRLFLYIFSSRETFTLTTSCQVYEVPGFTANYIKSKGLGLDGVDATPQSAPNQQACSHNLHTPQPLEKTCNVDPHFMLCRRTADELPARPLQHVRRVGCDVRERQPERLQARPHRDSQVN